MTAACYQVVELLLNSRNEIEDYSLNYPHFTCLFYNGKHRAYGIIDHTKLHGDNFGILFNYFRSAEEAEDYLLDVLEN